MNALRVTRIAAWAAVVLVVAGVAGALYWKQNQRAAAFGGPFTLTDQTGATVTEAALQGPSLGAVLRLHLLPRRLPDDALRHDDVARGARSRRATSSRSISSRSIRSATRRTSSPTYLQAFDPRITGLTGTRAAGRPDPQGLPRLFAARCRATTAAITMDHTATVYLLDKDANFTGTVDYQEEPDDGARQAEAAGRRARRPARLCYD